MRALWVTNLWPDERRPWYGSFVFSQAQSLRSIGVELDVLYIPGYRGRAEYGRAALALRKALRRQRYDLVHAHYGHAAAVARLQSNAPLIVSYCGSDLLGSTRGSAALARVFAQLARVARRTITKSEEMASRLPRGTQRYNRVIPNGVDLSRFAPMDRQSARRRLGWEDGIPNVLFVGRPDVASKNLPLAERVCQELERRGQPVVLRVAARIDPGLVPVWMNAADLLLFPSLSEGSPNAIKEAMACELPIVSGVVGDVPARLRGVEGTFVVPHEVGAMADAVLGALRVGRAPAARQALADLSLERVAERIADVYREATG